VSGTGPDKLTVEALWARSRGRCEITGVELAGERSVGWHVHHRRPRQMGGSKRRDTNGIENLLLLSPDAHARVESERTEAYANGWLVRQNAVPAAVPVLLADIVAMRLFGDPLPWFVLLTDDGGYWPVEELNLPGVS
jgi:5-methylcytosine-specific restriction protein A